jgi:hypothetical protein
MNHEAMTAGNGLGRRQFLRNSVLLTVPLMAGGAMAGTLMRTGGTFGAKQLLFVPTTRSRGTTVVDVTMFGALGDGVSDDTSAIQAAINSLPSTGGTVFVPAGTYLVDAVRTLKLRSNMHFQLDPAAILTAKPNSSDTYSVLYAQQLHDLEISGGQILGERDRHIGTTGEGGHCIRILGCTGVTIRDMRLADGWGDGLVVGPKPNFGKRFTYSSDVEVANIVCNRNRRNGLSITNVIGMKVYDSEFSDTIGTKPQCGIDIEPNKDIDDSGHCDQVHIENCVMKGNRAYGVNVWNRTQNLTITGCTIDGNLSCGLVTRGMNGATFTNNTICNNMATGMYIQVGSVDVAVSDNISYLNYLKQKPTIRNPGFYLTGVAPKVQKDVIVGTGTSNIRVGQNYYK